MNPPESPYLDQPLLPGLVPLAWIVSVPLPPLGFLLGLVIVTRPWPQFARRGVPILAFSILIPILYAIVAAIIVATHHTTIVTSS